MNVLIVAAHPDDEVLGAGGAIQWHVSKKHKVFVLILGEGITSRYSKREVAPAAELKKLKQLSQNSLKFLKVSKTFYSDFPDNRFDSVDVLDLVKAVERVKKEISPEIIYTHHAGDLNIDHELTCRAVITATRPMKHETVKRILSFEVPSSTEWNFSANKAFVPNVYMDISAYLEKKIKAFKMYSSEVMPEYHPRSPQGLRALAALRGIQVGKNAAEAYCLVRDIS